MLRPFAISKNIFLFWYKLLNREKNHLPVESGECDQEKGIVHSKLNIKHKRKKDRKKETDPGVQMTYKLESLPMKNKQHNSFPRLSNSSAPAEGSSVFYSTLTLPCLELPKTFCSFFPRALFPFEFSNPPQVGHHVLLAAVWCSFWNNSTHSQQILTLCKPSHMCSLRLSITCL